MSTAQGTLMKPGNTDQALIYSVYNFYRNEFALTKDICQSVSVSKMVTIIIVKEGVHFLLQYPSIFIHNLTQLWPSETLPR